MRTKLLGKCCFREWQCQKESEEQNFKVNPNKNKTIKIPSDNQRKISHITKRTSEALR